MSCQAAKCLVNLHDVIHDTTASCCADHYVLLSQDMLDHFTLWCIPLSAHVSCLDQSWNRAVRSNVATHTNYCYLYKVLLPIHYTVVTLPSLLVYGIQSLYKPDL